MIESTKAAAIEHARTEYPRESCGLVVIRKGKEIYWKCRNLAEGTDNFVIDPEDYAAADEAGDITGVIHSHPNARPDPSQADRVACEASGLPWYIIGCPVEEWAEVLPTGFKAPLIGREWSHGVLDCYALIRDWYSEDGTELLDFERHDDWWHKGQDLYRDNFAKAGFYRVELDDIQVGDVIVMQIASPVPNHAAIYIGEGMILHHLHGRLSCRDIYGGYWQKHTSMVLRHEKNRPTR